MEINEALNSMNPKAVVPITDPEGHGTFIASVAAGSEVPEQDFIGAAPASRIVMVKLKPAKEYLREFFFVPRECCRDVMSGWRKTGLSSVRAL